MKNVFLFLIQLYWRFVPENKRNKCLYKVSCSHHVYKTTMERGIYTGIKSLVYRMKNCRPGYFIVEIEGKNHIITKNNSIIQPHEIRIGLV